MSRRRNAPARRWGGKQIQEALRRDGQLIRLAVQQILQDPHNPEAIVRAAAKALEAQAAQERRIDKDLETLLQRPNTERPTIEARMRQAEEDIRRLKEIAEIVDDEPKVTQFPRREGTNGK